MLFTLRTSHHVAIASVVTCSISLGVLGAKTWYQPPSSLGNGNDSATLGRRVQEVNFKEVPLEDVLSFVKEITNLSITASWKGLARIGITKLTPITYTGKDLTVNDVMKGIVGEANRNAHDGKAAFACVKANTIEIAVEK